MFVEEPKLEPAELQRQILANLGIYTERSAFECFALLMGKAQLLEFGLKNLLQRTRGIDQSQMERWTLGTVASEMAKRGFRSDYVHLLKDFVQERNYIAHEMLANNAVFRSMAPAISARFELKQLQQPAFNLERLLILHDWCEEYKTWGI